MTITVDIYIPGPSVGLHHDFDVLDGVLKSLFKGKVVARKICVPMELYKSAGPDQDLQQSLGRLGDIAIFLERALSADFLKAYREKAIFINPEWFYESDRVACEAMGCTILHKSRHFYAVLQPVLAKLGHVYTGFTSIDPAVTVTNRTVFSHFRGASRMRLTQELLEIWRRRPDFPLLRVQAYGTDIAINTNIWVGAGNTEFFFGELDRSSYFMELSKGGIKLCTSQVEGFGHYLNEARAMSALTIALDAPPMNELITPETGILVPVNGCRPQRLGMVYDVDEQDLLNAITCAITMPVSERERKGLAARALYEQQAAEFAQAFHAYLRPIVEDIGKERRQDMT
jgi:hypothetical protein